MTMPERAGAGLLALCCALMLAASPAVAQRQPGYTPFSNGVGPAAPCAFADTDGAIVACGKSNPQPTEARVTAASTAPLSWSTSTTATFGPWAPQLGRDVYAAIAITGGSGSVSIVATTTGACADGYQLSSANGTYIRGSFSGLAAGRYREDIGGELQAGAQLCATVTPGSGATISGSLAQ